MLGGHYEGHEGRLGVSGPVIETQRVPPYLFAVDELRGASSISMCALATVARRGASGSQM